MWASRLGSLLAPVWSLVLAVVLSAFLPECSDSVRAPVATSVKVSALAVHRSDSVSVPTPTQRHQHTALLRSLLRSVSFAAISFVYALGFSARFRATASFVAISFVFAVGFSARFRATMSFVAVDSPSLLLPINLFFLRG